jgi:acyl dehydratase
VADAPAAEGTGETARSWDVADCLLYAVAVGAGPDDLQLATENTRGVELQALPTFGAVLAAPDAASLERARRGGRGGVHAEQAVRLHRPLPTAGEARAATRIVGIAPKRRGSLITAEVALVDQGTGELLATTRSSFMVPDVLDAEGEEEAAVTTPIDDGAGPWRDVDVATAANQALLYRLCGDRNPLHTDPAVARQAGFERPILHGLCTFGIVGRVLVGELCGGDASAVTAVAARFVAPVVPGEALVVEVAELPTDGVGERSAHFRCRRADGELVLDRGLLSW